MPALCVLRPFQFPEHSVRAASGPAGRKRATGLNYELGLLASFQNGLSCHNPVLNTARHVAL
eukprot:487923-Alexandrium_andersonii.AAC.1